MTRILVTLILMCLLCSCGSDMFASFDTTVAGSSSDSTTASYYVDANAVGTNTGETWANAFTDLQSALSVATSGE